MNIVIINGPNLNLLGEREPKIYGKETLKSIEKKCKEHAKKNKIKIDFFQSNIEGEIVTKIQKSRDCVTWKANKEFIVHIIDNFDVYESVKDKAQLIQSKKFEWIENLDYLNSNINNPENNCK